MRGLTRLLPALYDRFGEKGVRGLQYVFYRVGEDRAPIMREYLHIDPDDARSLGRVLDYEDGLVGVRGIWTEETKGRAVKEERYCPAARELESCPEVRTRLMMAMEAGTFSVLNPDLKVPELTKLLSTGDDCCLATIELPLAKKEAGKASPHATPDAFPPVLKVPGLQGKLAIQGIKSLFAALVDDPHQGTGTAHALVRASALRPRGGIVCITTSWWWEPVPEAAWRHVRWRFRVQGRAGGKR